MTRGRAYRRFQLEKRKDKIRWLMRNIWDWEEEDITEKAVGWHSRLRGYSSCYMCGNPRKYWNELTVAEKKFLEE